MRVLMLLAGVIVMGCASSGSTIADEAGDRTVAVVGAPNLRIRPGDGIATASVSFSVDRVWSVLPAIFDSLRIPLTDLDAAKHTIGNSGMKVYKQLGNTPLSKLINCGSTQGFPSADTYDVFLSVMTQVTPTAGGGSTVTTKLDAAARPMAFNGAYTTCTSLVALEKSIVEAVNAKLTK